MNGQGVPKGAEVSFTDWLHLPAQAHVPKSFDTGFLFIPDLTAKATGAVLITLIVLYVGTQLASSLLMSITTDKTHRLIFMALPFFFVIFIINFPAGLLVYWITTNTWTILQQYIIRRTVGPIRPPVQADGSPAPSPFAQLKEALTGATGGSGSGGGGGSGGGNGKGNGAGSKADRQKVAAGAKAKGSGRGSGSSSGGATSRSPSAAGRRRARRARKRNAPAGADRHSRRASRRPRFLRSRAEHATLPASLRATPSYASCASRVRTRSGPAFGLRSWHDPAPHGGGFGRHP